MIATIASYTWYTGLAVLWFGDNIFEMLGMAHPEIYIWMKSNKVAAFFGLFFINNIGAGQLTTGAFEVYIYI